MRDPLLEVDNLHVIYKKYEGNVYAVNGISFSLFPKEAIGLVGETGAGKTTTALSIMQLLPDRVSEITAGSIKYDGEELLEKTKDEMRMIRGEHISMVFQDPMTALNPVLTVGDQIFESLDIHNTNQLSREKLQSKVDGLLNLVGIPANRKNEYPHQFSGGMKQRIVIAIALACEPKLLIADEPTTALDVTIQAQILVLIKELKVKLGTSLIMITHDLGVVANTCDKVAVMYAGEIIEFGNIRDIFESDKNHPYTKGLFEAIPNIDEKTDRLQPIKGLMPDPTDLPRGCKFHPRCPYAWEDCLDGAPFQYKENDHIINCNLFRKE